MEWTLILNMKTIACSALYTKIHLIKNVWKLFLDFLKLRNNSAPWEWQLHAIICFRFCSLSSLALTLMTLSFFVIILYLLPKCRIPGRKPPIQDMSLPATFYSTSARTECRSYTILSKSRHGLIILTDTNGDTNSNVNKNTDTNTNSNTNVNKNTGPSVRWSTFFLNFFLNFFSFFNSSAVLLSPIAGLQCLILKRLFPFWILDVKRWQFPSLGQEWAFISNGSILGY